MMYPMPCCVKSYCSRLHTVQNVMILQYPDRHYSPTNYTKRPSSENGTCNEKDYFRISQLRHQIITQHMTRGLNIISARRCGDLRKEEKNGKSDIARLTPLGLWYTSQPTKNGVNLITSFTLRPGLVFRFFRCTWAPCLKEGIPRWPFLIRLDFF